jgi:hypothetical protein
MKLIRLLLPAMLVFGLDSFSQPGLQHASQEKLLKGTTPKYELVALPHNIFPSKKNKASFKEKISLDLNNVTLKMIFKELRRKTRRQYVAHQQVLSLSKRINVHLADVTIEEFLDFVMSRFPVRCAINSNIIIIALKTFGYDRISCQVVDSLGRPVRGGFILVKGNDNPHNCDKNGIAYLENVTGIDTLIAYAEGLNSVEVPVESEKMTIILKEKAGTLPTYQVTFKNGIKETPAETATGSAIIPNMESYHDRNQDPNIIRRLQAISVPFPTNQGNINGTTAGSLRGINTFTPNRSALNVVNDHVLMASSDNINPIDIDSIYVNRDADAMALLGVASSNGVIYFDLKKGITSGRNINFYSSRRYTEYPYLNYQQGLTADMRIDLEKKAFAANEPMAWSPVFDLQNRVKNGLIDSSLAEAILQKWRRNDLKKDLQKAAYQPGVLQQYGLSIQTGTPKIQLYASLGVDDQQPVEKGDRWSRITGLFNTTYQNGGWQAQATVSIAHIKYRQNFVKIPTTLPYVILRDENGNPAPLPAPATTADTNFLNSDFVYQNEAALADHVTEQLYQSYAVKLSYRFQFGLKATVNYQFSHTDYNDEDQHVLASHFTRTLLNLYRQNDNGNISWPIPRGDIADKVMMTAAINSVRGQLDYQKKIKQFSISALTGVERRSYDMKGHAIRNYATNLSFYPMPIDYTTLYQLSNGLKSRVPYINSPLDSADHLFGYYGSATLSYLERYSFSISARTDRMNRFSPDQNQKGIGLWSLGTSWYVSREPFYKFDKIFSDLKVRFTCGQNGNVDYSIPPFHSIQSSTTQGRVYSYAVASTQQIGWEKLFMINAGIDFRSPFVTGSIDLYRKKGWDLLQYTAWNPTVGTSMVKSNSGSLMGGGIDLILQSEKLTISRKLQYSTTLLLAHTTNKVTSDDGIKRPAQDYTIPGVYIPRKGNPVQAIFAYPYGRLNENGAPRGYQNGELSEEYSSISAATDGSTIDYIGSATPTTVANMTHSLHYKSFTLSCLVTVKTGYYVRTPGLNYFKLLQQAGGDAPGYESRWKNKGDEGHTDIPALVFPVNFSAMQFYEGSRATIVKGDHIRLQDIQFSYQLDNARHKKFPFKKFDIFLTAANLGIIWRANNKSIDPHVAIDGFPRPRALTLTLKLTY